MGWGGPWALSSRQKTNPRFEFSPLHPESKDIPLLYTELNGLSSPGCVTLG